MVQERRLHVQLFVVLFLSQVCNKQRITAWLRFDSAKGLNMHTSKKLFSYLPPHTQFTATSSLAPSALKFAVAPCTFQLFRHG